MGSVKFFFFFFYFEGVPISVIEGVPNTEEIKKKIKKNSGFFSGQGVPRNTLSCKWRRHWVLTLGRSEERRVGKECVP